MGKKIYVLVGPPSIGKTTWAKKNFDNASPYMINRDDVVVASASAQGRIYDYLFVRPPSSVKLGEYDTKYGEVVCSPEYMT